MIFNRTQVFKYEIDKSNKIGTGDIRIHYFTSCEENFADSNLDAGGYIEIYKSDENKLSLKWYGNLDGHIINGIFEDVVFKNI